MRDQHAAHLWVLEVVVNERMSVSLPFFDREHRCGAPRCAGSPSMFPFARFDFDALQVDDESDDTCESMARCATPAHVLGEFAYSSALHGAELICTIDAGCTSACARTMSLIFPRLAEVV